MGKYITAPSTDSRIEQLRDYRQRFIFQGGSQYALALATQLEQLLHIARAAQALEGEDRIDFFEVPSHLMAALSLALDEGPDLKTRSQKLAGAGFTRRPGLWALQAREVLELIAAPREADGSWKFDREACRQMAAEALGRYDDEKGTLNP